MKKLALSAILFSLSLSVAKADLVPNYIADASNPATGVFAYSLTYSNSIDPITGEPVQRLEPGAFVTLYDIPEDISLTTPADWTGSIQNPGITAVKTSPDDGPLRNVTFTYQGSTLTTDMSWTGFIVNATGASFTTARDFTSQDTRNTGVLEGTPLSHAGSVATPAAVPEPGSMSMFGGAAVFAGLYLKRFRRS